MASCWVLPELRAKGQRCLPLGLHDLLEQMQEQVMQQVQKQLAGCTGLQHAGPELRGSDV